MKTKIIAIVIALIAIGGGISWYVYHSNQVKAKNQALCKVKAKEIRMSSIRLAYGLKSIVRDYTTNWNSAIVNKLAINMGNKIVGCDDFSKAMSWRWSFYDKVGSFQRIDSCMNKMSGDLSIMENNAECDTLLVALYKKEIELLEKLNVMSKKPNGSLLEYSTKASELFGNLDELDYKVSKTVHIAELVGGERVKSVLCDVWGKSLIEIPKPKTKVIRLNANDMMFMDLWDNLNKLSVQ